MPGTASEKQNRELQREWDQSRRSKGTKATIASFAEQNAKLDASKERDRKRLIEQQVSNSILSGVRGGMCLDGCTFLTDSKKGLQKPPPGKYRFGWKDGKQIMLSWPSQLTPDEIEVAKKYYDCI